MTIQPLVSASWLADRLDDDSIRFVDVREPWEYDTIGHLPGAVNIPFDSYRDSDSDDPGTLPGGKAFGRLLGEAGIGPDDTIVAYDDTHGVFAARFVLTALAYGHENAALLDGDFSSWRREYETSDEGPDTEPVSYEIEGLAADAPIVGREAVEAAIEGGESTLIDTRDQEEYDEYHLPGAIRLDWMELVDEKTRGVKDADAIEALLAERGVSTDRETPIILYCNTSRRLSHTFVALRSLGFTDVAVYEGSMADWLADDDTIDIDC
ncbi:sulfurtransferase [Halonotius terrestris]|uniref:Sulfurtransferase n=1 Tax=Halonotius terrestris TaxID=2487750 RepID=A0A8J8TC05_9EURY|nr:sulfurtransferase [Halonotius terrestris]